MGHYDLPASVGIVMETREELLNKMDATKHHFDGKFNELKSDVKQLNSDVSVLKVDVKQLKTDVSELRVDVKQLKTDMSEVKSTVHRIQAIVEEQRNENRIVLDGLKTMIDRQDRVEVEVADFRQTMKVFIKNQAVHTQ